MKPLIAITCSLEDGRIFLNHGYYRAVERAGGIPVVVPPLGREQDLGELLDRVHGLLLAGGPDVDPRHFNESPRPGLGEINPKRDAVELYLCREAVRRRKPVFGICRGIQVINIALGGSVYQDIGSEIEKPLKHRQEAPRWYGSHEVRVEKDSMLYGLIKAETLLVNSFHHQALKDIARPLRPVAFAPDGLVEAVEGISEDAFLLGVQWHPEEMWEVYPEQLELFKSFVEAAARIDE
ncbi:gamma-glutamyl-gamma-aminobutyrate hydrolase family protein [Thermosediminibacter oceani]|uniref:Peptidase C26 n=1 Tax=Thermosediminibacter oceani (strain ATCC BAA-1034 / DSM 16646 / JW/IW-1228P) TaxID=555079 RepID=D9RZ86_THEOJ|nr:gamma-glutamyl-gamma-aminobutyrate hydrolase family protein [Thermosediminibacter oceani]ADL08640.1 peptidase C26 [Thermosediminibacter oceani DSM 16646]